MFAKSFLLSKLTKKEVEIYEKLIEVTREDSEDSEGFEDGTIMCTFEDLIYNIECTIFNEGYMNYVTKDEILSLNKKGFLKIKKSNDLYMFTIVK